MPNPYSLIYTIIKHKNLFFFSITYNIVVGDYINTKKSNFYLSLDCLQAFFRIASLQVINENLFLRFS